MHLYTENNMYCTYYLKISALKKQSSKVMINLTDMRQTTGGDGTTMKLFMATHGHMASGMMSTLKLLFGACPNLEVFDAYVDENSVQEKLEQFFNRTGTDEEVLLLSDIYGSSVNQAMYQWLSRPHTRLVTGINLAFLVEVSMRDEINDEDLEQLIQDGRSALKRVMPEEGSLPDNNEDFF